jgi:hypothetical protein
VQLAPQPTRCQQLPTQLKHQLPLLLKLAGGPARGLTIAAAASRPALPATSAPATQPPLLPSPGNNPIGCAPALPPELCECLAALPPLLLLLLLLPPCFHAMDAAYQVLTRPSASCAATAAVQPPGRKLPRVCRAQQQQQQQQQHSSSSSRGSRGSRVQALSTCTVEDTAEHMLRKPLRCSDTGDPSAKSWVHTATTAMQINVLLTLVHIVHLHCYGC